MSNAEFVEFKAFGELQFEPLIVSEIANCGAYFDVAFQIDEFFLSNAANFPRCSCNASAFNRNVNQIVAVYCLGVNRYCRVLACACLVQLGAKVNYDDVIHCEPACECVSNLVFIVILYFPCDAIDRGSTVACGNYFQIALLYISGSCHKSNLLIFVKVKCSITSCQASRSNRCQRTARISSFIDFNFKLLSSISSTIKHCCICIPGSSLIIHEELSCIINKMT